MSDFIRSSEILRTENLTVSFTVKKGILKKAQLNAVDGVSVSIEGGTTLAVVGESGSGKTTFGKTLIGLIKPSAGAVYYRGQNIWKMDRKQFMQFRMKAQMIYQDPYSSLNPRKKVYDILAIPIRVHKLVDLEQEQAAVYSALEDVGLFPAAAFAEKYPFELSGGQRQRVAIARAMVLRPEIVVADEPITMLDASLRLGVLDTMLSLQKRMNLSLLFITHDLGMAYYIAGTTGKIAVIYLGSLVEYGPASEVLKDPLHPYTKALLSALPEPDPIKSRSKELMKLRNMEPTDPTKAPPGCKFSDRCPFAFERCYRERPLLSDKGDEKVACFLYDVPGVPISPEKPAKRRGVPTGS